MRRNHLRAILSASASVLAIWGGQSPALAQSSADASSAQADDEAASNESEATDAIVVTARRRALMDATARKRDSDTIIDSIVADDAGHLPDNSITEVLQRVAGVTMVRFAALNDPDNFSVEGSGIQVRGLSGVTSLLNGREVFSANGGAGLSWGDVTPELMQAVDVYKATRADMIEGGTGGGIDLRTKMPFDYTGFALEGSAGASRGDLAEVTSPSASFLISNRWDTPIGEVGLLVDLAYSEFSSESNDIGSEPFYRQLTPSGDRFIPGGFGYGDSQFNRTRRGFYEAFQWEPNDSLSFFQTVFISEYESDNTGASVWAVGKNLAPAPGTNAVYDSNGALIQADRMIAVSLGEGTAGSTIGQGWIPVEQQVDCNAPYGEQAQTLNWGTSPPTCSDVQIFMGSSRGFFTSQSATRDLSQGFTWEGERLSVRGILQYVNSTTESESFGLGLHSQITGYSFDFRGDLPHIVVENPAALADPDSYGWDNIAVRSTNNLGTMWAGHLDVEYDLDGFFTEVSAGIRYADRKEKDNYDGTYWAPLGRGWNGSAQRSVSDGPGEDAELYDFSDYFRGDINLPGLFWLPSRSLMQQRGPVYAQTQYGYDNECVPAERNPPVIGCTIDHAPSFYPTDDNYGLSVTRIDTAAAYLQTRFESESGLFGVPFYGNLGVRVVRNQVESSGNFVFGENEFYLSQADANADLADDNIANNYYTTPLLGIPQLQENEYTRVLPAANINFNLTDDLFLRFAANRTMSPPQYNDIRASGSGGIQTTPNTNNIPSGPNAVNYPGILSSVTANTGNPLLLPTMSTNLDVSVEWYQSNSFNIHAAAFSKDLEDLIIYGDTARPLTTTIYAFDGTPTTLNTTVSNAEILNAEETAHIRGLEFGFRKFFDELPGWMAGFGVEANYTYIDSENPSAKALDIDGQPMDGLLPIVGLSQDNYNVQFLYERDKLSLRAAYTWRSRYLMSTNSNGTNGDYRYYSTTTGANTFVDISLPVYAEDYGQWDLGANYQLNERLRFWLQANNVTDETTITLQGGYPNGAVYPRNYFISDRRISAGINFSF